MLVVKFKFNHVNYIFNNVSCDELKLLVSAEIMEIIKITEFQSFGKVNPLLLDAWRQEFKKELKEELGYGVMSYDDMVSYKRAYFCDFLCKKGFKV